MKREGDMERIRLYNDDCLNTFKLIEDKTIDLILIDPPYNIGKDKWDKWATVELYVEFMGKVFKECERVLKDNGSFYFFHNDFLQVVELQNWINRNTEFIFKSFLIWNKRYNGSPRKYYFDNVIAGNMNRNHRQLTEYCLYYTFQDETGLSRVYDDKKCFSSIKEYLREERKKVAKDISSNLSESDEYMAKITNTSTMIRHYWGDSQWAFPTYEMYTKLQETGYFNKPYEELRQEYEELRQEYESLRYTFNNQKTHHDVLDFEVASKQGHITPKPVDLLEYLIKTSSNENDVILDCFMGSGSTGVACANTNRRFIGVEKEEKYFSIAKERIEKASNISFF